MSAPRLLDLFCGAGGASTGYRRAGFEVVGVDIKPQPRYPFAFVQADALTFPLDGFDVLAGSPPCHDHSVLSATAGHDGTGWMLADTRRRFAASGLPYVIENVPGADMPGALVLCGSEFGLVATDHDGTPLTLKRHRLFESNLPLMGAGGCWCSSARRRGRIAGNYGGGWQRRATHADGRRGGYVPVMPVRASLMGIDWMTRQELSQAIPPAYTEHIGHQLVHQLHRSTGIPA